MNSIEICAVFRGAHAAGEINGWSNPVPGFWYVTPLEGKTQSWNWKDAHEYAEMLLEAGVKPRPIKWPES